MADSLLQALVSSIRDYAIFMLDPRGHIVSWNTGAELIKGYKATEAIGKHFSIFYPPALVETGLCEYELAVARRDGKFEDRGWRLRKDGSRFFAHVLITAIYEHDQLVGFAKVTRDLTREREAAEAARRHEERFRVLVEGVKEYAIFMLDPTGHVTTWNSGAERIKGYRADEIIGKHFSVFYPPEDIADGKTTRELAGAAADGRYEDEGWRLRKDGTKFWANVVITSLYDDHGHLLGYAKITRDLTERRRHEAERLRHAQTREAVRLRDEFLSIASHELRTPLTILRLQLDTLQMRLGETHPDLADKLGRALRASQRLDELVDTLLDVARIASGKFELRRERGDIAPLVAEAVEHTRELATRAGCTVTTQCEPELVGVWDRTRVEQILTNLLANAFKYAAGHPVEVTAARDGGTVVLTVRDHGPGLPEGSERRVFRRFERAAEVRHYGGLGLGLFVVAEIARAHGGNAIAGNASDGGAWMRVELPLEVVP